MRENKRCEVYRDHPRGCGEHSISAIEKATEPGSSPRMRGALCMAIRCGSERRIIPADAGSTSTIIWTRCAKADHPRGCGEHRVRGDERMRWLGSSPRMRGAPLPPMGSQICGRIIPADAGSTTSSYGISNLRKDHPRGCGEHDDIPARLSNGEGSSPRMRGALSSFILPRPVLGIIPADAGSTRTSPISRIGV